MECSAADDFVDFAVCLVLVVVLVCGLCLLVLDCGGSEGEEEEVGGVAAEAEGLVGGEWKWGSGEGIEFGREFEAGEGWVNVEGVHLKLKKGGCD